MYIHICISLSLSIYIYIYIYTYTYISLSLSLSLHIYIYIYVCMYVSSKCAADVLHAEVHVALRPFHESLAPRKGCSNGFQMLLNVHLCVRTSAAAILKRRSNDQDRGLEWLTTLSCVMFLTLCNPRSWPFLISHVAGHSVGAPCAYVRIIVPCL